MLGCLQSKWKKKVFSTRGIEYTAVLFFFSLYNWNIIGIQYWFQVCNIVVWHLYTLWNELHDMVSNCLLPYKVIFILKTIFSMPYIASSWLIYCVNGGWYFFILFTYFPFPSGDHQFVSVYLWVCFYFASFVCFDFFRFHT